MTAGHDQVEMCWHSSFIPREREKEGWKGFLKTYVYKYVSFAEKQFRIPTVYVCAVMT